MASTAKATNPAHSGPRTLKLLTGTWNAGNARPPPDLRPWIPLGGGDFDLIVVGFQECTFKNKKKKKSKGGEAVAAPSEAEEEEEEEDAAAEDGGHDSDDDALTRMDGRSYDMRTLAAEVQGVKTKEGGTGAAVDPAAPPTAADAAPGTEYKEAAHHFPVGVAQVLRVAAETGALRSEAPPAAAAGPATPAKAPQPPATATAAALTVTSPTPTSPSLPRAESKHALFKGSSSSTCPAFENLKAHVGPGFTCVWSQLMWQIGIVVLARNDTLLPHIDEVETGAEATGLMGITPNKGGVLAKLRVYGSTTLCFLSAHLAAHMKHVEHRNLNSVEILNQIRVGNTALDFDSQFSHCFFMGDLNYRVDLALTRGGDKNIESPERWAEVHTIVEAANWPALVAADQLRHAMKKGEAFSGFTESDIAFCPTFKVKRQAGTTHLTQRVSSYCDRVLVKSLPAYAGDAKCVAYRGHPAVATSDHKPVSAAFEVICRPVVPPRVPLPASISSSPAAAVAEWRAPMLRFTKLSGSGLIGMDYSGKSDVYALFYSDRELRSVKTGKTPRTSVQRQTVAPVWADDAVEQMKIDAAGPADLTASHVQIVLMDRDVGNADDRMGQAILPLKNVAAAVAPFSFELPVIKGGRTHGSIKGYVQLVWPGTAGAASTGTAASSNSCCSVQ